jgi:hypothetical protein
MSVIEQKIRIRCDYCCREIKDMHLQFEEAEDQDLKYFGKFTEKPLGASIHLCMNCVIEIAKEFILKKKSIDNEECNWSD